jgi:purine-binding chemotaxis protein CheW
LGLADRVRHDDQKVAIVEHGAMCLGLLFDRTGEVFRSNADERSDLDRATTTVVSGVFKQDNGRRLVQILDIDALFALKDIPRQGAADVSARAVSRLQNRRGQRKQCISFRVGSSTCALGIECIQEILKVDRVNESPLSVHECIGTIDLRGTVVLVIDLPGLLRFRPTDRSAEATTGARRVIVMRLGDELFGLLVDAVDSLVPYFPDDLLRFPVLNRERAEMFLGCISRPEGDIVLLDHAKVFTGQELHAMTHGHSALYKTTSDRQQAERTAAGTRRTFITFAIDSTYAVGINEVREILELPETLLYPPGLPSHVRGLVNLRGELVAIVDARKLYGKGEAPATGKVLVFKGQRVQFGLMVDAVEAIVSFAEGDRIKLPDLLYKGTGQTSDNDVQEAVEVDDGSGRKRNLLLLNPRSLTERIERSFAA